MERLVADIVPTSGDDGAGKSVIDRATEAARVAGDKAVDAAKAARNRITPAGVGVGVAIGSAAIVAALLYAKNNRKTDNRR